MRSGNFSLAFVLFFLFANIYAQEVSYETQIYNKLDTFLLQPLEPALKELAVFERTLPEFLENKETLAHTILLCNLGYFQRQNGQTQKAISSYEKAWKLYGENSLKGYDIIDFCLKPLGNLYTQSGNYALAENTITTYLQLAQQSEKHMQTVAAVINLSALYQSTGENAKAVQLLQNILKKNKVNIEQRIALTNNLATHLISLDKLDLAEEMLTKTIDLARQNNRSNSIRNLHKNLALIALRQEKYENAEIHIQKAISLIEKDYSVSNRDLAKLYLEAAGVYKEQEDFETALTFIRKAFASLLKNYDHASGLLPEKDHLYPEPVFIDLFDQLGLIYADMGAAEDALKAYESAFDLGDQVRQRTIMQGSKLVQQYNHRLRTERGLQLLHASRGLYSEEVLVEKALYFSGRSKAVVFHEERLRKKFLGDPEALALARSIAQTELMLIQERSKGKHADASMIAALETERIDLNKALQPSEQETLPVSISLKTLQKKLKRSKATLLEFVLGTEESFVLLVSPSKVALQHLGSTQALSKHVLDFIALFEKPALITNDVGNYQNLSYRLYQALQLDKVATENLVLIPDSVLSFVPFEALITSPSTSRDLSRLNYMVTEKNCSYHFATAAFLQDAELKRKNENILGFFPVFEGESQPLNFSLEEYSAIQKVNGGNHYLRDQAMKQIFIDNASGYDILHLSTHATAGSFDLPAQIRFYDQTLYEPELIQLDLSEKLVVLSACETGIGVLKKGEGPASLARSFGIAGADRLVFSLWKVNDLSASQWMRFFYETLDTSEAALATSYAKRTYLESKEVYANKKSPYYWATFVHYGNTTFKGSTKGRALKIGFLVVFLSLLIGLSIRYGIFAKISSR